MYTFPGVRQTSLTKGSTGRLQLSREETIGLTPFCSHVERQGQRFEDSISRLTLLCPGTTLPLPSHATTIVGNSALWHVKRYEKVSNKVARITMHVTCQFLASSSV